MVDVVDGAVVFRSGEALLDFSQQEGRKEKYFVATCGLTKWFIWPGTDRKI